MPIHINKKSVFYNSLILAVSSILLQLMGFIYRIGISRTAGAQAMGVFQLVMPVYAILTSFTMSGITLAVSQLSSKHMILGEQSEVRRTVSVAQMLFLTLFFIASSIFISCSEYVSEKILGDIDAKAILLLLLPCLLLTGFENIYKACFHGIRKVRQPIASELSEHFMRIVFVLGLIIVINPPTAHEKVMLIVLGMIGGEIISSSMLFIMYSRLRLKKQPSFKSTLNKSFDMLDIAVPMSIAGLFNNLISSATTILIPKCLVMYGMSQSDAIITFGAMFGMTIPLLMLPCAFISPLITVIVPRISQSVALDNNGDIKRKVGKALQFTSMVSALFMAVLIPLGKTIAISIYKESIAGDFIIPVAICCVFTFYHMVTGSILNGISQQKKSAFSVIFVGVLQLLLTALAVPRFGMAGFVYSMLISDFIGALMNYCFIRLAIKTAFRIKNWFIIPWISGAFAGLTASLTFGFINRLAVPESLALISALIASIVAYMLSLRFQGISFFSYIKKLIIK